MEILKKSIERIWEDQSNWKSNNSIGTINEVINYLDQGKLRVAEFKNQKWEINEWLKKAILLYFAIREVKTIDLNPFEFCDKIPLKKEFKKKAIRVVPPAFARYGAFIDRNVILMPSFVNIGAYVGEGTMIDTWATIGSCAQIGARVHLSGGVGIGGVLEPLQASPVIIEDDVFVGSRCVIVEGVHIEKEAVLGAGVVLTASTKIIDVSGGASPLEIKGRVPQRSVVIPGSYPKKFPAGIYQVPCALIIGQRRESTDKKTSLNQVLRDFSISV